MTCWACGGALAPATVGKHALLRCAACGLLTRAQPADPAALAEALRRPRALDPNLVEEQRWGKAALRAWQIAAVEELCPPGRLLDVGSGFGFFLETARGRGWEAQGAELSKPEWRYATETFGLNVANASLEEARFPDDHFDVVSLWEVAELLPDPAAAFREALRVLKPGGWLWMRNNNARFHAPALALENHPLFRWTGARPGIFHVHGIAPRSLDAALSRAGFENIHHRPSPTTQGNLYALGGTLGAAGVVLSKKIIERAAAAAYRLTGEKEVVSSTFITRARKPHPAPLVLHVITRLDRGGSAENVVHTVERTNPARWRSLLVCGQTDAPTEMLRSKPLVVPALRRAPSLLADWRAYAALKRLFKALKPAVVHTHSSKAGILGRWAAAAAGVPSVVHTPHGHVFYGYFGALKTRFFLWLEKKTAPLARTLVALTPGEARESIAAGVGTPAQWRVVHSGVQWNPSVAAQKDALRSRVRSSFEIPAEALVVGALMRLDAVKGVGVLAEMIPRLPFTFFIVGDGPERWRLENVRRRLPDPARLVLAGHQPDPFPLLAAMDIYVQPSRNEGMGKTLVLAQAMGLPVVASRVCGIPDVVKENETGLLVPPGDPHALAVAIDRLAASPAQRQSLGARGRTWVNETADGQPRFGVDRMVRLLEGLYEELASL